MHNRDYWPTIAMMYSHVPAEFWNSYEPEEVPEKTTSQAAATSEANNTDTQGIDTTEMNGDTDTSPDTSIPDTFPHQNRPEPVTMGVVLGLLMLGSVMLMTNGTKISSALSQHALNLEHRYSIIFLSTI